MAKITPGQSEVTVAGVVQAVTSASFDDEKGNQIYLRGPEYSRLGSLLRPVTRAAGTAAGRAAQD